MRVKVNIVEIKESMMWKKLVDFVKKSIFRIDITNRNIVLHPVPEKAIGLKIKSIRYVGKEDVYCMYVPKSHAFIANGIVVHNCLDALRYVCYTGLFNKSTETIDWNKVKAEAYGYQQDIPRFFQQPEYTSW